MPQENIQKFLLAVAQDPAMKEQILTAPDRSSLVSTAVKLGNEKGYSFTEPEVESWLTTSTNQSRPDGLSDADLESIAGGKSEEGNKISDAGGVAAGVVNPLLGAVAWGVCRLPTEGITHSNSVTAAGISCN